MEHSFQTHKALFLWPPMFPDFMLHELFLYAFICAFDILRCRQNERESREKEKCLEIALEVNSVCRKSASSSFVTACLIHLVLLPSQCFSLTDYIPSQTCKETQNRALGSARACWKKWRRRTKWRN